MLLDEFASYNDGVNAVSSEVIQQRMFLLVRLSKMVLVQEQIKRSMAQLIGRTGISVTGESLAEAHRLLNQSMPANGTKP